MSGQRVQAFLHQHVGTAGIASMVGEPCAQVDDLGPVERRVSGQPVETVFLVSAGEPVEQQPVPQGQRLRPLAVGVVLDVPTMA